MPIRYKIYRELELMYAFFYGKVDKTDAFEYSKKIYNDSEIAYAKNTLVFLQHSNLIYTIEEVEEFGRLVINNKKFKLRNKIAILVDSPSNTVAATIYAQTILSFRKGIEIELFYTLEAALSFLELEEQKERIDEVILSLSQIIRTEYF